jgi:HSP20 family molecular chaperone IbpA
VPVITGLTSGDDGEQTISLLADIGRIFRPCDVTVRFRGHRRLLIVAEASETTSFSQLTARVERTFDLPADVDRKSLVAGFTDDGLVRVTAKLRAHLTRNRPR